MGFQKKECIVREEKERNEGFGFGWSLAWTTSSSLSSLPVNQIMLALTQLSNGFLVNLEWIQIHHFHKAMPASPVLFPTPFPFLTGPVIIPRMYLFAISSAGSALPTIAFLSFRYEVKCFPLREVYPDHLLIWLPLTTSLAPSCFSYYPIFFTSYLFIPTSFIYLFGITSTF